MVTHNIVAQVTRRNFIKGLGLMSATAALAACAQQADGGAAPAPASPLIAIIHTNDTHGHDVEVATTDDDPGNFSMAAVPALRAEWEAKGYEVIVVDAGDATQGVPLVDVSHGSSAINFMNACGYDLMAPGNHEFDWGQEVLAQNEKDAKFPFISANILLKETGEPRFAPHKIVELAGGGKVGFFGLTTPATLTTTRPKNVANLEFLQQQDLAACAQAQVDELRNEGCDLVVCVAHLGNEEALKGNTSKDVLQAVTGIDVFIDGHDHKLVEEEVNGTLLVETECYLHNIGVVAIDEGVPANNSTAYGTFEGVDSSAQAVIDTENARVESELGVVLGETSFVLDGSREPGLRTQETNLGDFCADALWWTANQEYDGTVDAGLDGGGGIRSSVEVGDITLKTAKTVKPFSSMAVVIEVTGAQLLEALEAACQLVGEGALGAFPQVSNITFEVDASIPFEAGPDYPDSTYASPAAPGSRVTILDVAGKGFDEGATYTLATTDFIAGGGDTYYTFKQATDAKQPVTICFDYEAFVSYLVEGCGHVVPASYAEPQGRITIKGLS